MKRILLQRIQYQRQNSLTYLKQGLFFVSKALK